MTDLEALENKLRNDAAIACTLLIGDSWPVWELLKCDTDHFKREAKLMDNLTTTLLDKVTFVV